MDALLSTADKVPHDGIVYGDCIYNSSCNHDLRGLTTLTILDRIIDGAAERGIYVRITSPPTFTFSFYFTLFWLQILLDMHNLVAGVQASGLWCVSIRALR